MKLTYWRYFISSHPWHPEPKPQACPRAHHERGVSDFGVLQKELRQPLIGRPAHFARVHEAAAPLCQLHHQKWWHPRRLVFLSMSTGSLNCSLLLRFILDSVFPYLGVPPPHQTPKDQLKAVLICIWSDFEPRICHETRRSCSKVCQHPCASAVNEFPHFGTAKNDRKVECSSLNICTQKKRGERRNLLELSLVSV